MRAQDLERPATRLLTAASLAALILALTVGESQAQFVNPVPPPAPPTLNPSTPSVVPQTPETPVSPNVPGGLSGSSAAPSTEVIAPPSTVHTRTARSEEKPERRYVRHTVRARPRWSERRMRYASVPVLGPSYYPGIGLIYPPYANPCHFRPISEGFYGEYWTYRCS